jgi:motility quorum-sensing regulator / GCU-specific mRNA interferase toxin
MEKFTPHCKLVRVKALIVEGRIRLTRSAQDSAALLGFGFDEVCAVVLALQPSDFYKSMTTHLDFTVWQDVYRPTTVIGAVYLKLTVVEDVLVVSFKEV